MHLKILRAGLTVPFCIAQQIQNQLYATAALLLNCQELFLTKIPTYLKT